MAEDRRRTAASQDAPEPGPSALHQIMRRRPITPSPGFLAPPSPAAPPPYRHRLDAVLDPAVMAGITRSRVLRFHCLGDTGGWGDPRPQREVAGAMAADLDGPAPVHFLYHLGDVVYPHGEEAHYHAQFFSPYAGYRAPIFAIPGNHDGESLRDGRAGSLEPFVRTFCSASPPLHDAAVRVPRPPAAQPHVYWTLVHEWLRIIGLYTNVHEDGEVEPEQLEWLTGELAAAPREATVILAMHRPVYSVDVLHGSNLDLGDALEGCFARAGRVPDAVLAGHAHAYQRFTRRVGGRLVPYIVAGAGGFRDRHAAGSGLGRMPARFPGLPDLTLDAQMSDAHGFLTVIVGVSHAEAAYSMVTGGRARRLDAVRFGAPAPA